MIYFSRLPIIYLTSDIAFQYNKENWNHYNSTKSGTVHIFKQKIDTTVPTLGNRKLLVKDQTRSSIVLSISDLSAAAKDFQAISWFFAIDSKIIFIILVYLIPKNM